MSIKFNERKQVPNGKNSPEVVYTDDDNVDFVSVRSGAPCHDCHFSYSNGRQCPENVNCNICGEDRYLITAEEAKEKTVQPALIVEINVTCPWCNHYFDLLATSMNDEGELLNAAIPRSSPWVDAHERFKESCKCPECRVLIKMKGIKW